MCLSAGCLTWTWLWEQLISYRPPHVHPQALELCSLGLNFYEVDIITIKITIQVILQQNCVSRINLITNWPLEIIRVVWNHCLKNNIFFVCWKADTAGLGKCKFCLVYDNTINKWKENVLKLQDRTLQMHKKGKYWSIKRQMQKEEMKIKLYWFQLAVRAAASRCEKVSYNKFKYIFNK